MVRNLKIRNGRPSLPMRFWRKKTGPRESSVMSEAITRKSGQESASPMNAKRKSKRRLTMDDSPAMGGNRLGNGSYHISDVFLRHLGVEGQGNDPLEGREGMGEILGSIPTHLPIVRMHVKGDKVDARADLLLSQKLNKVVATDRKGF